jgi:Bacterial regulatory helix-turn-helix protein, lysR family
MARAADQQALKSNRSQFYLPDISLDLRYLRYAFVAAEHGSFRRAAMALNISQSARAIARTSARIPAF